MGVVPRDPGIIESSTVLENLVFGLDPTVKWAEDKAFLQQLASLCARMKMNKHLFSSGAFKAPMMQALGSCQSHERGLVSLVRALLAMPDVLLIQDVGVHRDAIAASVHAVLLRFAQGHNLAGILAEVPPSPPAHPPRTVVWSAPPATLSKVGITELVDLSDHCELRLNGSAENAYELLGLPKVKLVVGTAVSHSNVPLTTTHGTALRGSSIGREADTAADDLVAEELDSLLDATVG